MLLDGCIPYNKDDVEKYTKKLWWSGRTLGDLIDKAADIHPRREALSDGVNSLTYEALRDKINLLAIALMELGIEPKDRVLLQLPNWNEFVYSYFALQKIGAIPVVIIARYKQHEVNHICRTSGAKAWIVPGKHQDTDYTPVIDNVVSRNSQLKHIILVRGKSYDGHLKFDEILKKAKASKENLLRLEARKPGSHQIAHMGPTGGTTGLPKIVPHIHRSLLCKIEHASRAWELGEKDVCLISAPAAHDLIFTSGICAILFSFGKILMLDSTNMNKICESIQKEKVTSVVWVPTLAARLVESGEIRNYDLSSLKKMHCGGGAASAHLVQRVTNRLNCKFFHGYGGTEGMMTVTRANYETDLIHQTVGRPGCPHDIYKVVNEAGVDVGKNVSGELIVKGPSMFTGYYNDKEINKTIFDANGFFHTGDRAKINEKGDIIITGRFKEIIKRGGESISAIEIENLIVSHPEVKTVAVIGMPDPEMGERVCAYIEGIPESSLDFDNIIDYLKKRETSVLLLPERIEFIEKMPLTKALKLDKNTLKEDLDKKMTCM